MASPAIDRYLRAVRATGAPERGMVASQDEVDEVVAAVAPLTMPEAMIETWLRVGITDWLLDDGELQSPHNALESLRIVEEVAPHPRPLFPVSYASHTYVYIELDTPGGPPGGALLTSAIPEELWRHAPSLAWAFDFVSSQLESGRIGWDGSWWTGRENLERELRAAAAEADWPAHLRAPIAESSPLTWPPHWQVATGIVPALSTPLGASGTVQDLFALSPGQSIRVHARVVALASSAAGSRAGIADKSGEAVVFVPSSADPFVAVRIREFLEFDLEVAEPTPAAGAHPTAITFDAASYRFRATMVRPLNPNRC